MLRNRDRILLASVVMVVAALTGVQDGPAAATVATNGGGEATLACVADTYIAAYPIGTRSATMKGSEQGANAGTSKRLKLKKYEAQPILKFDFSKVPAGSTITGAAVEIQI